MLLQVRTIVPAIDPLIGGLGFLRRLTAFRRGASSLAHSFDKVAMHARSEVKRRALLNLEW